MIEIGKTVKVIKNSLDPDWNFLVGKVGTVVSVLSTGWFEVQFDYDDPWASQNWCAMEEELEEYIMNENSD